MRHLTTLLSVLICIAGAASTSAAQTPTGSTGRGQVASPVKRWVTQPTPITLTAAQQKKVDSISAKFVAEDRQDRIKEKGQSETVIVMRMMKMTGTYQKAVRAILSPAQQAIFDRNVQAPVMAP
jgi:hypothetical protein